MASDNLMAAEQPWQFRATFSDAWISDFFTRETDAITKALQNPFAGSDCSDVDALSSVMMEMPPPPIQTPSPTDSGGSEKETVGAASKQRRAAPPSGRVAKRKPRTSKRSNTTFVAVDPENFRQMVQQVTGVKFCSGLDAHPAAAQTPVLKPEPHRAVWGLQQGSVLDTSSYFVDGFGSAAPPPPPSFAAVADGGAAAGVVLADSICSYPTLESWKVM